MTCPNLAYTDRSIDQLRARLIVLDATVGDSLIPQPLRDRAQTQAETVKAIIDRQISSSRHGTEQAGHQ
ncbi:hypothetical protein [Protofrankia symbiont of Coriaria ruscifolia]|uniref:Uncharacterized protein n=1 Tax=Candidatus Protofrankia californiensis TaxID=1839754 RepID=A0A1C3NYX6_9ACTN|nr:hypothetical protein [Protofrankia symbiont of Coriaria ruscifolia]SBW22725.1 hypothetical protein FDG2_3035 [Candidatus Protofrankia californiensis]